MDIKKKHVISIALLLILTVIPLHNLFSSENIFNSVHYWDSSFFLFREIQKEIFEEKNMFLWSQHEYSGVPLLGHPETFFISLPLLLILLLKENTVLAVNLTLIISFFLVGLGMYLLVYELRRTHKAALIAAIIFMFNAAVFTFGLRGNVSVIAPLSMMPFVFLFMHKAFYREEFVLYALLASIFAAIQIHTGGMIIFLYTFILVVLYAAFSALGKNFRNRLIKISVTMLIFVIFSTGLSAIKLLPTFDFQEASSRAAEFSYNEFLGGDGHYIKNFGDIFPNLVKGSKNVGAAPQIGIVAALLVLMSFIRFRNKKVIFFAIVALISVLIASNTFLTYAAYKFVPFFGNLKNIDRFLLLFAFSSSILAGLGYINLENILAKIKAIRINKKYVFAVVILLLSIELIDFKKFPQTMERFDNKEIPILEFISKDEDLFRVHYYMERPFDLSHVIGSHSKATFILYNLSIVTGGSTIWPRELGQYLFLTGQQKAAKLWGILNVKYILSDGPATIPNTKLVGEFEPCLHCVDDFKKTHVYENENYVPRAYIVNHSILVLGNSDRTKEVTYFLLFNENFYPKKSVIVQNKKNMEELSEKYLDRFNVVMLASEIPQSSIDLLKKYVDSGGMVLPDIFNNKRSIEEQDIKDMFGNISPSFIQVNYSKHYSDKITLDVKGERGFLVLSEMFSNFKGWNARINNKDKEIVNADGVISAVYLDGEEGNLIIEYKPKSFLYGTIISSAAALLMLAYFSFFFYKKIKSKKG